MLKKIINDMLACIFMILLMALIPETLNFVDALVEEFEVTEEVKELEIVEITTYNPNDTDGIYIYVSTKDENGHKHKRSFFTDDKTYKIGDKVQVVIRDDAPYELLSTTYRKRPRTVIDRVIDVAGTTTMIWHIPMSAIICSIIFVLNKDKLRKIYTSRKSFTIITTIMYSVSSIIGEAMWIYGRKINGWDGLGISVMGLLLITASAILTLLIWLVGSIIHYKNTMKAM